VAFKKGMQKIAGSGRKKGQVSTKTVLARAGMQSAIQFLRDSAEKTPIEMMLDAAVFLDKVVDAEVGKKTIEEIAEMPDSKKEMLRKWVEAKASIARDLAEFAYPKLARVEVAGDAPTQTIEHRTIFVLSTERPGKPMTLIEAEASLPDDYTPRGETIELQAPASEVELAEVEEIAVAPVSQPEPPKKKKNGGNDWDPSFE
jgi:hypothetical protein